MMVPCSVNGAFNDRGSHWRGSIGSSTKPVCIRTGHLTFCIFLGVSSLSNFSTPMSTALELPDELWVEVLDFLDAKELISVQGVSQRLFKLARDTSLWRSKCFEETSRAPLRSHQQTNNFWNSLTRLTPSDGGGNGRSTAVQRSSRDSRRARAIADWDCTHPAEKIDWYSEYIARHAPLSTEWLSHDRNNEIRSIALFEKDTKVLSATETGSLRIYDIERASNGRRKIKETARSEDCLLFSERVGTGTTSRTTERMVGSAVDSTVVDSNTMKAYIAVDDIFNEVDLPTMKVVSRTKYPWRITAISQQTHDSSPLPLMVGTSYSLEMHDARIHRGARHSANEFNDIPQLSQPGERVVIFPNYDPDHKAVQVPPLPATKPRMLSTAYPSGPSHLEAPRESQNRGAGHRPMVGLLGSWGALGASPATTRMTRLPFSIHSTFTHPSNSPDRSEIVRPPTLESWLAARLEPGPQAILHRGPHEVIIAGRMPSILFYDSRTFPQLSHVLHSGARLSSLTTIPCPPYAIKPDSVAEATLVAGGEYHGRGSLELYELISRGPSDPARSPAIPEADLPGSLAAETATPLANDTIDEPCSYKNRQSSSSAKLLSVATQGTRIVFADSEGALKWVERDGRSLVRRWNINSYEYDGGGASLTGDRVARKLVAFGHSDNLGTRGTSGDGDLLVWSGSDIGIVTTRVKWESHQEMVEAVVGTSVSTTQPSDEEKAEEYARVMRQALERQADERRWMSRFGGRCR